jgi:membrane protein DedA with SNARE-associated domain
LGRIARTALFAAVLAHGVAAHATGEAPPSTVLPGGFDLSNLSSPWLQALALVAGTLVLEDTTAIAAGLLARSGAISMPVAMLGTGIGIFVGDLGLYLLGAAAARGARGTGWIRRRLPDAQLSRLSSWLDQSGWQAIALTRVVSGTRLPVYLGAGFVGAGFARFALWTFVAVAVWTPIVVGGSSLAGGSIARLAGEYLGHSPTAWVVALILLFATVALLRRAWTGRRAIRRAARRAMRFEFWPTWAVYGPLLPFFAWNAARHGFARTLTAVNPCWPDSGVVGESKQAGLEAFAPEFTAPSFRVAPDADGLFGDELVARTLAALEAIGWPCALDGRWTRPVVVKPDAGQRGLAVKVVRGRDEFRAALRASSAPVVVQRFEDGACEVGLFVIAAPGEAPRLFSICDKRFPHVEGDGRATLGELIARDPRLSLQEPVFRDRLSSRLGEVPAQGERIRLANAGNHSQGCLFVDGARLRTAALEAWTARAIASARGYHYGRLDVRFRDEGACMRGEGGVILEANGVTSESTNMYDPSWGAWRAWRVMRAHWREAFRIGAANRAAGVRGMTLLELLARHRAWRRTASLGEVAD